MRVEDTSDAASSWANWHFGRNSFMESVSPAYSVSSWITVRTNDSGYESLLDHRMTSKRRPSQLAESLLDRRVTNNYKLQQPAERHSTDFPCPVCPKSFSESYHLASHQRMYGHKRSLVCSICGTYFTDFNELKRHHSSHTEKICYGVLEDGEEWGCRKVFPDFTGLGRHMLSRAGQVCLEPLIREQRIHEKTESAASPDDKADVSETQRTKPSTDNSSSSELPHDNLLHCDYVPILPRIITRQNPQLLEFQDATLMKLAEHVSPSADLVNALSPNTKAGHDENSHALGQIDLGVDKNEEAIQKFPSKSLDSSPTLQHSAIPTATRLQHAIHDGNPSSSGLETLQVENTASEEPGISQLTQLTDMEASQSPQSSSDDDSDESDFSSEASVQTPSRMSNWPTRPSNAEQDVSISPILTGARRIIVERLMLEVHSLLSQKTEFRSRGNGSEPSESQSPPAGASSVPATNNKRKRSQDDKDNEEENGDGENDGGPAKRSKLERRDYIELRKKLACPYYQRDPSKHQSYRSCSGPGWLSTHRIKEHIYRRHALPIICNRCQRAFETDGEFAAHQRQIDTCELQEAVPIDGLDKEQEKKLKSRKKTSLSEEDKWREMYRILFPDDPKEAMPSPYYENTQNAGLASPADQIAQYERYMSRELPRRIRARLEMTFIGASAPLESQLRGQLVDIVRNVQSEVFRSYHQASQLPALLDEHQEVPTSQTLNEQANSNQFPIDNMTAWYMPPPIVDPVQGFSGMDLWRESFTDTSDSGYGTHNSVMQLKPGEQSSWTGIFEQLPGEHSND